MVVFTNVKKEDAEKLKRLKFVAAAPKTVHELIRYQKGAVQLVLYNSGKLLLQGKEEAVDKVAAQLERQGIGELQEKENFRKESGWVIGSDESLKGDTFGGLTVAAVKADDKIREQLVELGAADSKKLSDREVLLLADKIRKLAPCEVKSILPEEYNRSGKVTELLNKLHGDCADYLRPGKHVVDKYPGCAVGELQVEKGESKYVEIAAASILARSAALQQLNYLSKMAGFTIPKGSTHVSLALHELTERKLELRKFVKVDFSNVQGFVGGKAGQQ